MTSEGKPQGSGASGVKRFQISRLSGTLISLLTLSMGISGCWSAIKCGGTGP